MARAAAKRNQGPGKTAQPVAADQAKATKKKAEKSLEDQLFFSRLRGHAKWMFVLLAIVFGASFVFLGVGSGNGGLSDVFGSVFGGGGGPSVQSLQDKVAESPRDFEAVTNLAQALEADGRTEEAIAAYRTYLVAKPKDPDALGALAILYQNQAAAAGAEVNNALRALSAASAGTQFRPGTGVLGQALGSFVDPLAEAVTSKGEAAYQEALGRYQAANRESIEVYKKLSAAAPEDPSALIRYAQSAERAGEIATALTVYGQFAKRFPTDALVADVRLKIKELKAQQITQQAQQAAGGQG
jgi:tetratricopeptide (TPR) repeat protein